MVITQFLNPQEEKIDNDVEVDIDEIIITYSMTNPIHKTDDKNVIIAKIGYTEAIQALH